MIDFVNSILKSSSFFAILIIMSNLNITSGPGFSTSNWIALLQRLANVFMFSKLEPDLGSKHKR